MKLLLYILTVLILFGLTVLVIDNNRFVKREYRISGRGVKKPVRIAFLTDLHENCYGRGNSRLIEAVLSAKPDLILIGGDMIISDTVKNRAGWYRNTAALLKGISGFCPVYYADGNHEMRLKEPETGLREKYRELENFMASLGTVSLHNKKVLLKEEGISLCGLELDKDCYRRFFLKNLSVHEIEKKIGRAEEGAFNLLLTHNPDYFRQYADWGADAVLCGHVHGGVVRIPFTGQGVINPRFVLFPRYTGGRYEMDKGEEKEKGRSVMVLSCGLGMHTLPVRAFNPAELSVIDIIPEYE